MEKNQEVCHGGGQNLIGYRYVDVLMRETKMYHLRASTATLGFEIVGDV